LRCATRNILSCQAYAAICVPHGLGKLAGQNHSTGSHLYDLLYGKFVIMSRLPVPGVACYIHSFFSSALSYSSESFLKPERHDDLTEHQTSSRPFERTVANFLTQFSHTLLLLRAILKVFCRFQLILDNWIPTDFTGC
jgi:hypothetical protein